MLCELGLRERLVGRSRYCTYPPEVESVPVFGDLFDVDLERVHELDPDLILIAGHSRAQADRFQTLGIRIEALPDSSLADISTAMRALAALCGVEPAGEAACQRLQARLDAVDAARAGRPAARVLICLGALSDPPRPPHVAAAGSFYDDLLRRGGHINAAPASAAAFAPLSLEAILAADPDVIVEFVPDATGREAGDADALAVWARVGDLKAVKARRVRVMVGPQHYVPGPRVAETYADLMAAIDRQ
jgi:ABC-type Fe3+-hydroxamate transport system substrate-binding protein